jgi:hypothetical protein
MILRLSRRLLFIHTKKHTQKCSLDFKSSEIQHDWRQVAVCGWVALNYSCLIPSTPHPFSISANRHPTVPPPPKIHLGPPGQLYTLFCTNDDHFFNPPPSFLKVPVIFYFYCIPLEIFGSDAAATIHPKVGGISLGNQVGGA